MMRFFFPSLFPTHSLSLSPCTPMRTLSIIFTLSFSLSLSLFSLRDAERREQRIGYAHASLSICVFFYAGGDHKSPIFFCFFFVCAGGVERRKRREEERSSLSRDESKNLSSSCCPHHHETSKNKKKFEVSSQVPRSERAPLHTTKFFFFIHLKSSHFRRRLR